MSASIGAGVAAAGAAQLGIPARRLLMAGTASGSGKTSVVCGLLAALRRRGLSPAACKCGPDYIDPMFHREILGVPSRNLDLFLSGEDAVKALLAESARGVDITVIEGVMGFYDGLGGTVEASSHDLALRTGTPVLLVADCRGSALTLAASLQGLVRFTPNRIAGILLNRCSERSYPMLREAVEQHTGVPVVGWLPRLPQAELKSRHLGLVTAAEVEDLRTRADAIARQLEATADLDAILRIAAEAQPLPRQSLPAVTAPSSLRIAVAQDAAFCFTYEDNLLLLRRMGAEIIPFSPLQDDHLPENIHGLILSGGYPELHAAQLSGNASLLQDLRRAIESGLPTVAECGGFMLLCRALHTQDGSYPMAGALDTTVRMTSRLAHFGYITLTARRDTLLCPAGAQLRAHEFHYSEAEDAGSALRAEKRDGAAWDCIHATDTLWAGYPHLHLWGQPEAARRLLAACQQYRAR